MIKHCHFDQILITKAVSSLPRVLMSLWLQLFKEFLNNN